VIRKFIDGIWKLQKSMLIAITGIGSHLPGLLRVFFVGFGTLIAWYIPFVFILGVPIMIISWILIQIL